MPPESDDNNFDVARRLFVELSKHIPFNLIAYKDTEIEVMRSILCSALVWIKRRPNLQCLMRLLVVLQKLERQLVKWKTAGKI